MSRWTTANLPSQRGRIAIVTGTGGLGFEDALELTRAGAEVIIAGRNPAKGREAVDRVKARVPGGRVAFEALDLADLASVRAFAERLRGVVPRVDLLINNAAVMAPPTRQVTTDGFELQFGINYLGHFALTAALLPLLRQGRQARVVHVSSIAARQGAIHFDDLQSARKYAPMVAYAQSKLACLMFAIELQRHSDSNGWSIASIAAHPGVSRTELIPNGAGQGSVAGVVRRHAWFLFQPAAQGALPTLFAATDTSAQPGAYYGPDKLSETRGYPSIAKVPPKAMDADVRSRLWRESERLVGAKFE